MGICVGKCPNLLFGCGGACQGRPWALVLALTGVRRGLGGYSAPPHHARLPEATRTGFGHAGGGDPLSGNTGVSMHDQGEEMAGV